MRPAKRRPDLPWSIISRLRSSKSRAYQLSPLPAALRHGVEADRPLAFGRQLRVETGLQVLLGQALGVLRQLGERHVGGHDLEAGGLEAGLEPAQPHPVRPDRHDTQVGLVAEHREGDHLWSVALARLDRGHHGLAVGPGTDPAEQVEDPPAH